MKKSFILFLSLIFTIIFIFSGFGCKAASVSQADTSSAEDRSETSASIDQSATSADSEFFIAGSFIISEQSLAGYHKSVIKKKVY